MAVKGTKIRVFFVAELWSYVDRLGYKWLREHKCSVVICDADKNMGVCLRDRVWMEDQSDMRTRGVCRKVSHMERRASVESAISEARLQVQLVLDDLRLPCSAEEGCCGEVVAASMDMEALYPSINLSHCRWVLANIMYSKFSSGLAIFLIKVLDIVLLYNDIRHMGNYYRVAKRGSYRLTCVGCYSQSLLNCSGSTCATETPGLKVLHCCKLCKPTYMILTRENNKRDVM